MKNIILEDLITPNFPAHKIIPQEEDFKDLADLIVDKDNIRLSWARFVDKAMQKINGDQFKMVRWLIASAMFRGADGTIFTIQPFVRYLRGTLKDNCLRLGYSIAELKMLIEYARTYQERFDQYYEKYCEAVVNGTYDSITTNSTSNSTTNTTQNNTQTATTQTTTANQAGGTPNNIKIVAQPGATFYRIVAYDPKYNPPVRRHIYLTRKQGGSYRVSLGGATVTSWYNEPFFESVQQAEDFIKNITRANTKTNVLSFEYSITDKPVKLSNTNIFSLGNCVLVNTDCGPAYIHRKNQYCVESIQENLEEDIEKHGELNPVLFENNKLKPEIREKCLEIVDVFLEDFKENNISFDVKDIIIIGSNASYNYTKDSDIDIHIVADVSKLEDPDKLYPLIYDAYKSLFNKRLDIKFYDIPVEVYVETQDTPLVSNGIYSIQNDDWIKEPEAGTIPEVNQEEINKAVKPWENRYKTLIKNIDVEKETDEAEIEKYITEIYKLRHAGLAEGGEYSVGNLVFKEIRNKGYLDELKELKNKVIANNLSILEAYKGRLSGKELNDYRIEISKITNYPVLIQENGLFEISNVKEEDFRFIQSLLGRQDYIEYVQKSAEKLDFSKMHYQGIPGKRYKLIGKIRF